MTSLAIRAAKEPERYPWGAYRDLIESKLGSCADYLRRLSASLAGEIASDRHYFAEKAWALREAADELVEACVDVEHLLGECGVEYLADEDEDLWGVCTLPAGHEGDHDDNDAWSATEGAYRGTQRLKEAAQRAADVLAGLPWRRGVDEAAEPDAETADVLDVASSQIELARVLGATTSARLEALGAGSGHLR